MSIIYFMEKSEANTGPCERLRRSWSKPKPFLQKHVLKMNNILKKIKITVKIKLKNI